MSPSAFFHTFEEDRCEGLRDLGRVMRPPGLVPAVRPVQHSENGIGRYGHGNVIAEHPFVHRLGDQVQNYSLKRSRPRYKLLRPNALFSGNPLHFFLNVNIHMRIILIICMHKLANDCPDLFYRIERFIRRNSNAFVNIRSNARPQNFAEQFFLAAEVVVDSRTIEPCLSTNFRKRRGAITALLELLSGNADEFIPFCHIFRAAHLQGRAPAFRNVRSLCHCEGS